MTIVFAIIAVVCIALLIVLMFFNKKLEGQVAAANQESERLRKYYDSENQRVYSEAQAAVAEAQKQIDQQLSELKQESERIRQHYETEARRSQEAADALVAKANQDFEPLRKYEKLRDAEVEAQVKLADALKEAADLRAEAQTLLAHAKNAAADERLAAEDKAKYIHEQADARLNQAIRDAGRIIARAEERAEQIGGDAYRALREKETLEQAAEAIRNKIDGYGDRYLVPAHNVLDDLADRFGYDAAGQALKSARALSARMVEHGEAATCDYAEANRRNTAIQFVVHAFNGEVDSILSKVMNDNSGTLAQRIRDAFSTVNKDGSAFRNARILPTYLDARLVELDCAVRMREFVQKVRDEQRAERERIRDEQKAEQERQEKLREAAREKELMRVAVEEAEKRFAQASADQKAQAEKEMEELRQKLADATKREFTIAQQTRKGSIYIISNEGSFGPGVYKIGFTRRDPEIRVDELYNASVPFEFEIHGVIMSENAPELEYKLHRQFLAARWNKRNFAKEFFRVDLKDIREAAVELAEVSWRETEAGRAAEWQQSREIDNDPQAKEKWLLREQAAADERWRRRERRLANRHEPDMPTPSSLADSEPEADESSVVGREF
jgi:hypothetical protein